MRVIQKIENSPRWYYGLKKNYSKLKKIDSNGVYFIYDTGEIYVRDKPYTEAVILYEDGSRPYSGASDRLYINSSTLEGFTYHDGDWVKVLEKLDTAVSFDYEDAISKDRVNGVAVLPIALKHFMDAYTQSVSSMEYDETNHSLIYRLGSIGHQVPITNLVQTLQFDVNTRTLYTYDGEGNLVSEAQIMDSHVISGKYDDERKAIIFQMRDGSEVRLHAYALLNLFQGADTTTMTNTVHNYIDGKNVLESHVIISIRSSNKVEAKADGLYVSSFDPIANMEEGQMYVIMDDADYITAGVNIKLLATEAYVQQMKDEVLEWFDRNGALWLKRKDVIQSFNDVPLASKVPSFDLVNRQCGLRRL